MSGNVGSEERSKRLAEALLKGWKMLSDNCPVCGSPLFETPGGEVVCAVCGTRVILVGSEEEVKVEEDKLVIERIMRDLIRHLEGILHEVGGELSDRDIERINSLLDAIQKTSFIYRNLSHQGKRRKQY